MNALRVVLFFSALVGILEIARLEAQEINILKERFPEVYRAVGSPRAFRMGSHLVPLMQHRKDPTARELADRELVACRKQAAIARQLTIGVIAACLLVAVMPSV